MPMVMAPGLPQQFVKVLKTEEKGSNVNLATHLLHDAHMNRFDVAVVVALSDLDPDLLVVTRPADAPDLADKLLRFIALTIWVIFNPKSNAVRRVLGSLPKPGPELESAFA